MKNIVKDVEAAVEANNAEEAAAAFKVANSKIHSFVSKGVLKKNTAARKVSRLAKLVKSLEAAA
jgi:small subunit ribosomal protein S20